MNWVFFGLITISVITAAFTGRMQQLTDASLASAKTAVELAIGLLGQMTLWLGFVGVLKEAGFMNHLARLLKPLMVKLFPEVPHEHPAMGAIIMNTAANMLGLGNAATPFGLKAMRELDHLNKQKGVATNSMVLFLAINTSGVAVLPLGVIAVRATLGSKDPAGIIVPSMLATAMSTVFAVLIAKLLERRRMFAVEQTMTLSESMEYQPLPTSTQKPMMWRRLLAATIGIAIVVSLILHSTSQPENLKGFDIVRSVLSSWMLPVLMLAIVTVGFARQVKVYEAFVSAAKEGFTIVVTILPFLVAVLVSVGLFRASGAMETVIELLAPLLAPIGFPPEALPMALIRPLSGSGAFGIMTEAMQAAGPDSFVGYLVSVLNGTTETTFYVLALYAGAVQVRVLRHALPTCVMTDIVGPMAAFLMCRIFFTS